MLAMHKLLDIDFDNLELSTIGSWPLLLRVIVLCAASAITGTILYMFYIEQPQTQMHAKLADEKLKRLELEQKSSTVLKYEEYMQQLTKLREEHNNLFKTDGLNQPALPLLAQITNVANQQAVSIEALQTLQAEAVDVNQKIDIDLTLRGQYHNLGKVIAELAKLAYLISVHNFRVTQLLDNAADGKSLRLTLAIKTGDQVMHKLQPAEYTGDKLLSPFKYDTHDTPSNPAALKLQQRKHAQLLHLKLKDFTMVGFLRKKDAAIGLVQDPTGNIHVLRIGTNIGDKAGKVISINAAQIEVLEHSTEDTRGWQQATYSIKMRSAE